HRVPVVHVGQPGRLPGVAVDDVEHGLGGGDPEPRFGEGVAVPVDPLRVEAANDHLVLLLALALAVLLAAELDRPLVRLGDEGRDVGDRLLPELLAEELLEPGNRNAVAPELVEDPLSRRRGGGRIARGGRWRSHGPCRGIPPRSRAPRRSRTPRRAACPASRRPSRRPRERAPAAPTRSSPRRGERSRRSGSRRQAPPDRPAAGATGASAPPTRPERRCT